MTKIFLALLLSAGGLSIHNAEANSLREMAATVTEAPADTAATASLKAKIVLPDPKIEVPRQTTSVKHTAKNYTPIVLRNKVYDQVQDNRFVDGYISNYAQRYSNHLAIMAGRAAPHFNMIEKVFSDHGVPEEMKYLAVIESGMSHTARSRVGAVGMWQFMSSTARIFGLSVGKKVDERKDVYKSTVAAAKYLKELHTQFGDWLLVVAAYNCGPGNLMRAQRISGRSDFWGIQNFLPAESRNHVYKFIATGYILDKGGTRNASTHSLER
jgi:membrane-bound lytic murein transglycosylase D